MKGSCTQPFDVAICDNLWASLAKETHGKQRALFFPSGFPVPHHWLVRLQPTLCQYLEIHPQPFLVLLRILVRKSRLAHLDDTKFNFLQL